MHAYEKMKRLLYFFFGGGCVRMRVKGWTLHTKLSVTVNRGYCSDTLMDLMDPSQALQNKA
jgi:hypothetical protein